MTARTRLDEGPLGRGQGLQIGLSLLHHGAVFGGQVGLGLGRIEDAKRCKAGQEASAHQQPTALEIGGGEGEGLGVGGHEVSLPFGTVVDPAVLPGRLGVGMTRA